MLLLLAHLRSQKCNVREVGPHAQVTGSCFTVHLWRVIAPLKIVTEIINEPTFVKGDTLQPKVKRRKKNLRIEALHLFFFFFFLDSGNSRTYTSLNTLFYSHLLS